MAINPWEIQGIIFDLDGVLVPAPEWHRKALNQALIDFSLPPIPLEEHESKFNGMGTREKLVALGYETTIVESVNKRKQELTEEIIKNECVPSVTVRDFVRFAHSVAKIAVATNCLRPTALMMLEKSNIIQYFSAIITASDVERKKPFPDPYIQASLSMGVRIDDCLAIDDTKHGISSSLAAGIKTWHLSSIDALRIPNFWNVCEKMAEDKLVYL